MVDSSEPSRSLDRTRRPAEGKIARARDRFAIPAEETVEVVVSADRQDFLWNAACTGGVIGVFGIVASILRVVEGAPFPAGLLGLALLLALGVGLLVGALSVASPPELAATDRGLRVRDASGAPILIPWEDIVDVEGTIPFASEYRVRLRENAPALDRLSRSTWSAWKRDPQERIIGANTVWDVGGAGLEAIRDAMDRHAVRAFPNTAEGEFLIAHPREPEPEA